MEFIQPLAIPSSPDIMSEPHSGERSPRSPLPSVGSILLSGESMSEEQIREQFPHEPDEDTYDWSTVQDLITFKANKFGEGFGTVELHGRVFRIRQRGWLVCYFLQKK